MKKWWYNPPRSIWEGTEAGMINLPLWTSRPAPFCSLCIQDSQYFPVLLKPVERLKVLKMCYVLSQKIKIGNAILFWTLPWWHGTDGIFVFRLAFAFAFAFVLPRFTPVGIERKRKCKLTKIKKCFNSLRWTELAFAFPWGWFISVDPLICVCVCIARVTPMLKKKEDLCHCHVWWQVPARMAVIKFQISC